MITAQNIDRIQYITIQIKRLTSELSILTGAVGNSVKEVTDNPDVIIDIVMDVFGCDPRIKSRKANYSIARYAATYLLRRYTRLTRKQVSELQNGVEHSVISYRVAEAIKLLEVDSDFQDKMKRCITRIEYIV